MVEPAPANGVRHRGSKARSASQAAALISGSFSASADSLPWGYAEKIEKALNELLMRF